MSALDDRPVGVLGAGALGRALAVRLARSGVDVELWARRHESAASARELGLCATTDLARVAARPVLLVCVRDAAIAEVAALACAAASTPVAVALHTSGCTSEEVLDPLRARGANLGWWHPLTPVASGGALPPGTPFGLGGEAGAVAQGEALARRFDATVVRVARGAQARYHAAASLAAGGTVALAEAARALLAGALCDPDQALFAVRQLVQGAAENLGRVAPHEALTGPAVRHDLATLASHRAALDSPDPAAVQARALVRALAPVLVELVRRRHPGEPERARALARALDELFGAP